MHTLTLTAAAGLGQLDIFENIESILDVGGGSGSLSMESWRKILKFILPLWIWNP